MAFAIRMARSRCASSRSGITARNRAAGRTQMPMTIVSGDKVFAVKPPATADYKPNNPLARLMSLLEGVDLAAEREQYLLNQVQYLIPYDFLELYGPSGGQWDIIDPRNQDNKEDFQKQNINDLH